MKRPPIQHASFNGHAFCDKRKAAVPMVEFFGLPKIERCLMCEYRMKAHGYDVRQLEQRFKPAVVALKGG